MKTIRWGIIGCGDVTEVKSGPAFSKAENSSLTAVMRRSADKAADYARRHEVAKWYDDATKLIHDPEVDAVYIATPPDNHPSYTLQVLEAGKPVYVEKPMARSYAECRKMNEAAKKAGLPLFTAYYRRSLPRFLKVKELIDTGTIGAVRFIRIYFVQPPSPDDHDHDNPPWRVIPEIAGGGKFIDLASHMFDILDYYFGPITIAYGVVANHAGLYPAEDFVSADFQFKNGVFGSGIWCFSAPFEDDVIEITGEKGTITFACFMNKPVILRTVNSIEKFEIANPEHIQQPHIQSIVDSLNGTGHCPSNGESAARASLVMDQILTDWRKVNNIHFSR